MSENIKKIEIYKDFKEIIQVFKEPPFSEVLSEESILEEFNSYLKGGIAYGYYKNGSILGFIGILKGIQHGHPIKGYNSKEVLYINGVAVLKNHRKYGIASKLVNHTLLKTNPYEYNTIYLRTNYIGSKIEHVASNAGFNKVTEGGIIVTEDVTFERNTGEIETDKRMFMIKKLK